MTQPPYKLIDSDNRISAIDAEGREICGAFKPVGLDYWQLFTTKLVTKVTGVPTPPHRENYWGQNGRVDSKRWVELIAALYVKAVQTNGQPNK